MNEIGNAEAKLQAALVLDPLCEGALYHLALLTYRERKQLDSAYQLLQRLLAIQPNHSNGILLRARLLSDRVRLPGASGSEKESALEDAIKTYEQAMTLHQGSSDLIVVIVSEYLRFIQSYGSSRMKVGDVGDVIVSKLTGHGMWLFGLVGCYSYCWGVLVSGEAEGLPRADRSAQSQCERGNPVKKL